MKFDDLRPGRPLFTSTIVPMALGVTVLVLGLLAARAIRGRVEARRSIASISQATDPANALAKRGKLLYQVQCMRCHGLEGHGDGPDSADLRPPPRDFASDLWRFDASPESIRKVIVEGITGTAMYPTGGTLSPRELDALVEHVRSLAPAKPTGQRPVGFEAMLKAAGFEPVFPRTSAPGFDVEDMAGRRRSLEFSRSGKPTLLVFWGTSCAPCVEELPELGRLADDFHGRRLDVIPVCVDESDRGRVAGVLKGKFDRFPAFLTTDGMAGVRYDLQTLPVAALIDRQGLLLGMARGGVDWRREGPRRLIAELLAERLP